MVVTWGKDPEAQTIIEVDPGVQSLTLASALIDPDHPTVTRPEPDWPWSTARKLVVFGGSALVVVLPSAARCYYVGGPCDADPMC